ncbi:MULTISPECIES: EAL and HDOD domain-containing protein [unclassified Ectothiorhodospira]|uniref:EAL and HDOD domain-containing protein n=1 Tax=unclassified Ectothiorhodospira TaxID=2684909 RepID=UPI001EE95B05|nr:MULTISPECIES: HDOD domain-containing protein [unclassified Ectothiorhodospira]MCG5515791.1 HDOD domain-containing protein [Ectothiorhodospira sp. 9100]MCG5518877.1 HDOD domain-containing protein [Ectothiorhodospira sp. 9905]
MSPLSTHEKARTIQVGRQAIFDRDLNVFAYELLYRDAQGDCRITDVDHASSMTLLNAFMEMGLDRVAGPHKAFINLTRHFFVNMPPVPFDRERVVLEILEDVEVDDALLAGVANMREQGFKLALDDYAFQPPLKPLLSKVHYIKVEINSDTLPVLARELPGLRAGGARLLAEKVETREQFEQLKEMGFDYFQGYFFARPVMIQSRRVEENASMVMQLIARLNDPNVPINEVVSLVSRDPALSYKVLRYVNSSAVGLRTRVQSIQHAVVLMGLQRIRAWATLFAMSGLDSRPSEIINLGLLRANLCERLCRLIGQGTPETAYTVGLLSILDAMIGLPFPDFMDELPLADEIKKAITEQSGLYGQLLKDAVALENNQLPHAVCAELDPNDTVEAFAASSDAAFQTLALMDTSPSHS